MKKHGGSRRVNTARRDDGQAIVEFILILPIFLGLIFVAIGFGITLNNYLRVTDVAHVAARAAAVARFSVPPTTPCDAADTAATESAGGLTLTEKPSCTCPTDGDTCAPGDPITVSVTVQSQNALNTIPFLSLALPTTLTGQATVLVQ